MSFLRRIFLSKYTKLLNQIKNAHDSKTSIMLPNRIELNFSPGHEYDHCCECVLPHYKNETFFKKYSEKIGKTINLIVYDSFHGDVIVRAVGEDKVLVEIVDVTMCYDSQTPPPVGSKHWIGDWEITEFYPECIPHTSDDDKVLPF